MKKTISYIILALPLLFTMGCTKMMEDMNRDPKTATPVDLYRDGKIFVLYVQSMEENVDNVTSSWIYQVQQNLNADLWAGYTMHPGDFGVTNTNDNYNFKGGWNDYVFSTAQTNLNSFLQLKGVCGTSYNDFLSYGLILKVLSALPVVDGFGPFPYLQYGTSTNPAFDNVNTIYLQGFIPELNFAIDTLEAYQASDAATRVQNSGADISSFGGDITKWIKLANTLKLRLAMRISNVDPTHAQQYVQECFADPNGFLDVTTGDFGISISANNLLNPFYFISKSWEDCVMGADMQSFMDGFADPREAVYFLPSTSVDVPTGSFAGVRPGIPFHADKGEYANFSQVIDHDNWILVSGAESYFLLAEAATHGWVTGTPQSYYEAGVQASFTLRGVGDATAYLASTNSPADYVDYTDAANNYAATTNVTPKWGDGNGTDMEKIITQKWIAIFPNGAEAWADFRRTGFPKLELPMNMVSGPNADNTIPQGEFLKRMPYSPGIIALSSDAANAAVSSFLNGKDDGNQPLWWQPVAK